MNIPAAAVDAVTASINIHSRLEAAEVLAAALPHYRRGKPTGTAILAACRVLYSGFNRYEPHVQQCLGREALGILLLAAPVFTNQTGDEAHGGLRRAS